MRNLKKWMAGTLIFCMLLGIMPMNALVVEAATVTKTYQSFPVNIFDYDAGSGDDHKTGSWGSAGTVRNDDTPINKALADAGSDFRFRWKAYSAPSLFSSPPSWEHEVNYYSSNVTQGMVQSELDNGKIKFNNNYDPVGILDPDTIVDGKTTYANVLMPFQYSDGYYTFDSSVYDVYFAPSEGSTEIDYGRLQVDENRHALIKHSGSGYSGSTSGFFPFNQRLSTTEKASYHFGMTFSTDFFMTESGQVDGQDITFEFAGDDDVWVFIDGKLVLDMGGNHDKAEGTINFRTGATEVDNRAQTNLYTVLGQEAEIWRASEKPHTLQVFYLERGAGESNCKIKFNLPQKDSISVTKTMGNVVTDQAKLDTLNEQRFEFVAYSKAGENGSPTPYAGKNYYIFDSNGQNLGQDTTEADGTFRLRFGQTAKFYQETDIYENSDAIFWVEEKQPDFVMESTTWTANANGVSAGTNNGLVSPSILIEKMNGTSSTGSRAYTFNCTNTVADQAFDDLVVLDFGKPVTIDVLANDVLFSDEADDIQFVGTPTLTEGKAEISNNKVVYTPTSYMDAVDTFDYQVGEVLGTTNTATVSVMPANNVYYEDSFVTGDGKTAIEYSEGNWTVETAGQTSGEFQSSDNVVYGTDEAYKGNLNYSDGSAHKANVGATAKFTFTGTGLDIYTRTTSKSGQILAQIKNQETGKTYTALIDNEFKAEGETGLYQIPTISFQNVERGTYNATLTVLQDKEGNSTYYLDAIRIYNPIDENSNPVVEDAYANAKEDEALFKEVREILLDAQTVENIDSTYEGAVYIDKLDASTAEIGTYEEYGPKNEVYLEAGKAIAFEIVNEYRGKVFIGIKAPAGTASQVTVTNRDGVKSVDIDSATDMYYEILPNNKQVVIQNSGDALIAITEIRITGAEEGQVLMLRSTPQLMSYAATFALLPEVEDEEIVVPDDDITVPDDDITVPDNDNKEDVEIEIPETPDEEETPATSTGSVVEKFVTSLMNSIKNSLNKWFGRW